MPKPSRVNKPRTCILREFQSNLSDINKYLSYYIFISSQFIRQNQKVIQSHPEKQTTEVFLDNPQSKQFDVVLSLLEMHTSSTNKFIFDSIFLYCFFELDNYLKEIYKFIQKIEMHYAEKDEVLENFTTKIHELESFESLKQVAENLKIDKTIFIDSDYQTFEYFRLRRNTIAHRNIAVRYSGTMKKFIDTNGDFLNSYWNSSTTVVKGLDFSTNNLQFDNKDSIISVINILRDTVPKLEEEILLKITDEEWIEFLYSEFKKEIKAYDLNLETKFVKSFNKFASLKLNKTFAESLISKVIYKR